ncbi:hypothetical protein E2P81_ATG10691 [Venturia nashicola]|nr:hypothetical protein E2P81_ATG10691 [Venturia nashicola]
MPRREKQLPMESSEHTTDEQPEDAITSQIARREPTSPMPISTTPTSPNTMNDKSEATNSQRKNFLTLPRELRQHILYYSWCDYSSIIWNLSSSNAWVIGDIRTFTKLWERESLRRVHTEFDSNVRYVAWMVREQSCDEGLLGSLRD